MKLPFGLIQGRLVSINEVQPGRACGALCPSCLGPLVARKGQVLVHHFAHDGHLTGPGGQSPCTQGYHVALQRMAGQLLSDDGHLSLPALTVHAEHKGRYGGLRRKYKEVVRAGATLSITKIIYNPTLSPDIQPSLLCNLDGFGPLAIELNMRGAHGLKRSEPTPGLASAVSRSTFPSLPNPPQAGYLQKTTYESCSTTVN